MKKRSPKKELLRFSEHFAFGEKTPLFASNFEIQEMVGVLEYSVKEIKKTKSPRIIVLETWLALDYCVRLFIISGLGLNKFSSEDFSLAFEFLPQSYKDCLTFLEDFIKKTNQSPS